MLMFISILLLFASIVMLIISLTDIDSDFALFNAIVSGGLFILSIGMTGTSGAFCDEKCHCHHENTEKSKRTIAAEQRQKAADVHQKFLDVVKDDPDFKIYFEKN